jgi:hypothetical protein
VAGTDIEYAMIDSTIVAVTAKQVDGTVCTVMNLFGIGKLTGTGAWRKGGMARRLVTDGLRSYSVAQRAILPGIRRCTSDYLNNRAEKSHRPTRRRERQMQRFKSPSHAQDFLSAHGMTYGHFRPRRHLTTEGRYRRQRANAFRLWRQETCVYREV